MSLNNVQCPLEAKLLLEALLPCSLNRTDFRSSSSAPSSSAPVCTGEQAEEERSEEMAKVQFLGLLCAGALGTEAKIPRHPMPGKHSSQPFCSTARKSSR